MLSIIIPSYNEQYTIMTLIDIILNLEIKRNTKW